MNAQKQKQSSDDIIICNYPNINSIYEDDEDNILICFDDQKLLEQTEYIYTPKLINKDIFFNLNDDNHDAEDLYQYFEAFQLEEKENAYIFSELTHKFFMNPDYNIDHNIFDHDEFCKSLVKCMVRTAKDKNIKPSKRSEYDFLDLLDNEFDKWINCLSGYIIPKFI